MASESASALASIRELRSLYDISQLPRPENHLQDYFNGVVSILSKSFPVGYSALVLRDARNDLLSVEALYGIGKETHPKSCNGQKGLIAKTLQTKQPAVIQNLSQEPLYEEAIKKTKQIEKIRLPLLCVPLIAGEESVGVMNINPLYDSANEYAEDFQFLSVLSAILSPVIKNYQLKGIESPQKPAKVRTKSSFLDEILEDKLTEILNKIDPYVESKTKMRLFDDIISLVEKILIKSALKRVDHVQIAAAQFLGINRNTLRKKMKDLKIKTQK
jgi:transcriptional regulator with GAF, ATPase, and Fis domain